MVDTMEVTLDTVLDTDMDLCGVARRGRLKLPLLLLLILTLKLILTPKLTHGFCIEVLEATMVDTIEVTLDTVLDTDVDLCGVARRGRLKLPPLLLLILTLKLILKPKLTHGFCIEVLEATMVDTMEVTLDTVLDTDMDLCGVARRGRLKLPPLLLLIL